MMHLFNSPYTLYVLLLILMWAVGALAGIAHRTAAVNAFGVPGPHNAHEHKERFVRFIRRIALMCACGGVIHAALFVLPVRDGVSDIFFILLLLAELALVLTLLWSAASFAQWKVESVFRLFDPNFYRTGKKDAK